MDLTKLNEFVTQANNMINSLKDIEKKYLDKIDDYVSELDSIVSEASKNSIEYKNRKVKEINGKIQGLVDNANKAIVKKTNDINNWMKNQQETIKGNIARQMLAKLGIPADTNSIEKMIKTIPDIPMPEIKIPELKAPETLNL